MTLTPSQKADRSRRMAKKQVSHLRSVAEKMEPLDAVEWLLEVIFSARETDEIEGLRALMDWGLTRQQAHYIRVLILRGEAGASYENLSWELTCNGEPKSKSSIIVFNSNVRLLLSKLGWPLRIHNLGGWGYRIEAPAGWKPPHRKTG